MSIVIFLIILLVLVIVHEAGHFFTAKKFGIRVDEFGFGFPPKLFGYKYGETEYTFNLLPLGGFVKIFGESPDDENTNGPDKARSFINKPKWQQALVLFAGVFANFILAWLLFSVGFMSGLPTSVGSSPDGQELRDVNLVVVSVVPDSPAMSAGLRSGDKIFSLTSEGLNIEDVNPDTLKKLVVSNEGKEIQIGFSRGLIDRINYINITPIASKEGGEAMIGIAMDQIGTLKLPFFSALSEGMSLTLSVTKATAVGLYGLVSDAVRGKGSLDSVTGPVGLVSIVGDAYSFGFVYLMSFAALISVNLAIINLVPFPALDGGRLLFLLIEKIKGSPISPKIANIANTIGFGILILLMIIITFHDVVKLF
jgi:regulator of sigma E protease